MSRDSDVMETNNINIIETKPFLIGVAGGTASGKVYRRLNLSYLPKTLKNFEILNGMDTN